MSTGSIKHNIEITDSADAERFVEALEKAKSESEEGMERLTDRDYCGMGICGGTCGVFADCGQCDFRHKINNRLAAYEDTGLTPEQIEAQQQEIDQLKDQNDTLSDTVNMFAPYIIGKKEAEVVEELKELLTLKRKNAALTADKDEQAERIMELDSGLERLRLSLQWLYEINTNRWYKEWAKEKIAEIDALLGGNDDAEKPQT